MERRSKRNWTFGRILRWTVFLGVILLVPVIFGGNQYHMYVATLICVYIIAIMGLNLTLGYTGQISLGHAAFMGIGAYTVALMTLHGHSFWLALPLGAAIAFVAGLILGLPSLRVKHHYLALVTLGFGTVVYLLLTNEHELTGGFSGLPGIPRPSFFGLSLHSANSFYLLVVHHAVDPELAVGEGVQGDPRERYAGRDGRGEPPGVQAPRIRHRRGVRSGGGGAHRPADAVHRPDLIPGPGIVLVPHHADHRRVRAVRGAVHRRDRRDAPPRVPPRCTAAFLRHLRGAYPDPRDLLADRIGRADRRLLPPRVEEERPASPASILPCGRGRYSD